MNRTSDGAVVGRPDIRRGFGSEDRPVAGVLWSREVFRPDSPALTARGNLDPDNRNVDLRRYYDPEFARAEFEKVWIKTWLFACREEDIPNIGDRVPLHIGPLSWFVVRSGKDSFKAYHNSCLHRGTMLCTRSESAQSIRCPYHGWEWGIDGRLMNIPNHWDFPKVTRSNASLSEAKLGRWGGFIFINADPDAAPLEEALGVIPKHFEEFAPARRYTAARFRKQVNANWKIVQEAFQEAYHLFTTHPEAVPITADAQTQYDVWAGEHGHVGRNASCSGTPSIHAPPDVTPFKATQMFAEAIRDWHYPGAELPTIDPDGDLRAQLGAWHRARIKQRYGRDTDIPDAMMMDSLLYFMFPHACFWLSESVPFTYQFTPHRTDPEKSYFEVRLLLPCPENGAPPPSAPNIEIGADESIYKMAPDFGFLGYVFDQDMSNLPRVQLGSTAANPAYPRSRLGVYQEAIIQHWNAVLDDMIERGS